MTENLDEILERLSWARSETNTVASDLETWTDEKCRAYGTPHVIPGFNAIIFEAQEAIPIGVRARSGTIANEIRSCLDALATELAKRNNKEEAYFPVAREESAFETVKGLRDRLKKFRNADREAIMAFRPFGTGKDGLPGNPILYGLHHADIKRKHHKLVAKAASPRMSFNEGHIGEMHTYSGQLRIPGKTEIGRISLNSSAWIRFDPIVQYSEPDMLRGRPLVETLNEFADVAESIVSAFL